MLTRLFCNCGNVIPVTDALYETSDLVADDMTIVWSLKDSDGVVLTNGEEGDDEVTGEGEGERVVDTDDEYQVFIPIEVAQLMTAGESYILEIIDAAKHFGIRCDCKAEYYRGKASAA